MLDDREKLRPVPYNFVDRVYPTGSYFRICSGKNNEKNILLHFYINSDYQHTRYYTFFFNLLSMQRM